MKWLVFLCTAIGIVGLGLAEREAVPPPATRSGAIQLSSREQETAPVLPVVRSLGQPSSASLEDAPRLFVVALPEGAVIIRAFSRSEYGSYQVRAEAWEWIERDMLADAIVHPAVTAADVAAFSEELSRTLRLAVNQASGFGVFEVLPKSE